MKKIVALLLTLALTLSCAAILSSCGEEEKKDPTVMTLSVNPKVEFILNDEDVVVSVNALNEEGNLVIEGSAFVGKTEEEAVKLYISICKETGFLITGRVSDGDNKIEIAYSDEDAVKRYDEIKGAVNDYMTSLDLKGSFEKGADIAADYLNEQLEKCMPYVDAARIEAMSYAEKLAALMDSREETAKLYSEELKEAYYDAKARAFEEAKFEYAKGKVNDMTALAMDGAWTAYTTAVDTLDALRDRVLVSETSPYQLALAAFREAKVAFLNYRNYVAGLEETDVTVDMVAHLDELNAKLDAAETKLTSAYEEANRQIDAAKANVKAMYDYAVEQIGKISSEAQTYLDEGSVAATDALTKVTDEFEKDYADSMAKAEEAWNAMKDKLREGYKDNTDTEAA